ncbi:MAG TPA: DUF5801 repeats-in-toxin domain-containing protein, partial [Sphingorhabdus sp.]|nr:DUF5801 repeats-in-toxin domain-containing protein [Sphingorhabdus sp.]
DNLITLSATATDRDGDSATATINLGQNLQFEDDGPSVTASTTQPVLVVDDTTLGTNATSSFAGVFAPVFGADGAAAANSVTYALAITAGPSGLVDVATGEAVNLVLNGSVVEGRSAVTNQLVFTVSVAANGDVTLDQIRAVQHNDPADPDEPGASAATLSADNLIRLIATVTDRDGDTATATANIGQNLQFRDDGPAAVNDTVGQVTENTAFSFNVFGNDNFGADGVDTTDVTPPAGVTFTQPPVGQGTVTYNPGTGLFTFTPAAGQQGSTSFTYTIIDRDGDPSTATVTINLQPDSTPAVVNVVAAVDDDGLAGGNAASTTGDIDANAGEVGAGVGNEAVYTGQINVNFGNDTGTVSFANLHNTAGTVGTETVTYTWSGTTLTATVNAGARNGTVLYTVNVTPSGAYTVTLLDNVLHANGGNETSAPVVVLNYLASDSDGDSSTAGTLSITFNDDAPTLGTIQNGTANNLPGSPVTTGALAFVAGADGAGAVGTITANTTGITSGGRNIVTNQVGNVLTGYADVDASGTFTAGDTGVFTLTVNPTAGAGGQYTFDLLAPLDGTIVNTPIGGSSSFGAGPTQLQVLSDTDGGNPLAIISGYTTSGFNSNAWYNTGGPSLPGGLVLSSVNGSTAGWGVDNNNLNGAEFMRFDFGDTPALDDFDGAGPYTPPVVNLPEVSFATFEWTNFTASDQLRVRVHYTDGTSSIQTITGAALAGQTTFTAPPGTFIDWIDIYGQSVGSGGGKVDLVSVGVQTAVVNVTIPFSVTLNDGDNDAVTGGFSVNVADGNSASTASSMRELYMKDAIEPADPAGIMLASNDNLLIRDILGDGTATASSDLAFVGGPTAGAVSLLRTAEQERSAGVTSAAVAAAALAGMVAVESPHAMPAVDTASLSMMDGEVFASRDLAEIATAANAHFANPLSQVPESGFAQQIGELSTGLSTVSELEPVHGLGDQVRPEIADLFDNSPDVVRFAQAVGQASPMGGDQILHNILDIAAASPSGPVAVDSNAPDLGQIVEQAMPDGVVDRMLDALTGEREASVLTAGGAIENNGFLLDIIEQDAGRTHDFAFNNITILGQQHQDMTTVTN